MHAEEAWQHFPQTVMQHEQQFAKMWRMADLDGGDQAKTKLERKRADKCPCIRTTESACIIYTDGGGQEGKVKEGPGDQLLSDAGVERDDSSAPLACLNALSSGDQTETDVDDTES